MNKPKVVTKLGLEREKGYLYFIQGENVMRRRMLTEQDPEDQPIVDELVLERAFERKDNYRYSLDRSGNVIAMEAKPDLGE